MAKSNWTSWLGASTLFPPSMRAPPTPCTLQHSKNAILLALKSLVDYRLEYWIILMMRNFIFWLITSSVRMFFHSAALVCSSLHINKCRDVQRCTDTHTRRLVLGPYVNICCLRGLSEFNPYTEDAVAIFVVSCFIISLFSWFLLCFSVIMHSFLWLFPFLFVLSVDLILYTYVRNIEEHTRSSWKSYFQMNTQIETLMYLRGQPKDDILLPQTLWWKYYLIIPRVK